MSAGVLWAPLLALAFMDGAIRSDSFDEARVGTIGASLDHYAPWKTVVGPDGSGREAEAEAFLRSLAARAIA